MNIHKINEIENLISRLRELETVLSKTEVLNNCDSDIELSFYTPKKGRVEINFKNHIDR